MDQERKECRAAGKIWKLEDSIEKVGDGETHFVYILSGYMDPLSCMFQEKRQKHESPSIKGWYWN